MAKEIKDDQGHEIDALDRAVTDKVPIADLEALRLDMEALEFEFLEDDIDDTWGERAETSPVPIAILELNRRSMLVVNDFDEDKNTNVRIAIERLNQRLLAKLDQLILQSADQAKIYSAIHEEMDKTDDIDMQKQIWDISMGYLEVVTKEQFKKLQEELSQQMSLNLLKINGQIRKIMKLIVSPSVRRTFVHECKKMIDELVIFEHQDIVVQAFILSMVQLLEEESQTPRSQEVIDAFAASRIPLPAESTLTPEAFYNSYPNRDLKLYELFQIYSEQNPQAAEAFGIMKSTQKLGIALGDEPNIDSETYQKQCEVYYTEVQRLISECSDGKIRGAILTMWHNIIAPQLALYGELLFSQTFLLPKA